MVNPSVPQPQIHSYEECWLLIWIVLGWRFEVGCFLSFDFREPAGGEGRGGYTYMQASELWNIYRCRYIG